MRRRIGDEVQLGSTVSLFHATGQSSCIDRTASNFLNASEKVQKIKMLINKDKYDTDLARYIPGMLEFVLQGMIENIDTKEQVTHISYKDMETLDFQIILTNNYYTNPNSICLCFPMKIKKSTDEANYIDDDLRTVNTFLQILLKK